MSDFLFYLSLGWEHIMSWDALDHLLFIAALVAFFTFRDLKQLLILITAFTIGHSLTLVLSAFNIVQLEISWVEFLIPLTITCTAVYNLVTHYKMNDSRATITYQYLMALVFGLVHGLGFANTARMMISSEEDILVPLLGFNIGLEAGQLVVIMILLILSWLISRVVSGGNRYLGYLFCTVAIVASLYMAITRIPF